ncbi:MAG: type II toxin-antitoxin system YafQ family toxin [Prevotella sp.]|jgi:mRNA interferase YafQ|nr:type II toxin-antitoxin system YafQ family toxin [Prevotella sp.]
MGKQLKKSTQFKKDLKRYIHQPSKLLALKNVTLALQETGRVPQEYLPHMLSGNYKGFMECHIEDNFLLIWIDETNEIIKLVRLGTHHELFGK